MASNSGWGLLRGVLFFVFWPIYIVVAIVRGIFRSLLRLLGVYNYAQLAYLRTVGWLRMKLGLWQQIAYRHPHGSQVGCPPQWVSKEAHKQRNRHQGKKTIRLSGRSFYYRAKFRQVGQKAVETRYYRKLKVPLYKRAFHTVLPRRPQTYAEAVAKFAIFGAILYIAVSALYSPL
jgi:hypothetical protein